jgi:predicted XRE-type DNA-binding protein
MQGVPGMISSRVPGQRARTAAVRRAGRAGKIDLFGLDTLVNMAAAAGLHVEMRIAQAA